MIQLYSKVYLSGTKQHLLPIHDMCDTFDEGNSIVLLQRTAKDVDADTIICSFYPTHSLSDNATKENSGTSSTCAQDGEPAGG